VETEKTTTTKTMTYQEERVDIDGENNKDRNIHQLFSRLIHRHQHVLGDGVLHDDVQ
jgi:hypothetical protein